jgi:hypothetical protein
MTIPKKKLLEIMLEGAGCSTQETGGGEDDSQNPAETRDGKAPAECGKRRIADSGAMRMFSRYASDLSVRPRNSGNHRGGFVPPSTPRVPGLERERRL